MEQMSSCSYDGKLHTEAKKEGITALDGNSPGAL